MLAGVHRTHEIDVQAGFPVVERGPDGKRRRIVDQHVDAAERLLSVVQEGAEGLGVGGVAGRCIGVGARVGNFAVSRSAVSPRAQVATFAPSAASPSAIERPMPRLPPMTMQFLPCSSRFMGLPGTMEDGSIIEGSSPPGRKQQTSG